MCTLLLCSPLGPYDRPCIVPLVRRCVDLVLVLLGAGCLFRGSGMVCGAWEWVGVSEDVARLPCLYCCAVPVRSVSTVLRHGQLPFAQPRLLHFDPMQSRRLLQVRIDGRSRHTIFRGSDPMCILFSPLVHHLVHIPSWHTMYRNLSMCNPWPTLPRPSLGREALLSHLGW